MANDIQIEHRNLADLKPYGSSPRVHGPAKRRKLRTLLRRFGQITPILIDEHDVIVDGHLVVDELKALGETQAKVVVLANRDPAEVQAIRLALNRLPMEAKWDAPRLKAEFEELLSIGFDMDLTGFDTVEIDMALAIDDVGVGEIEDAPPGPADGPAVSRTGDIWILGDHRLACGDCRDDGLVGQLMAGTTAQMVFTDPPYNLEVGGFVVGKGRHREFACASGEMAKPEFIAFLAQALGACASAMADGAIAYCCIDWRHLEELLAAVGAIGLTVINMAVWAKTNPGMGSLYRSQHELIFVLKKGDAPHVNNVELGRNGRSRSNLWTYRGMSSFGADRDELLGSHPTVKPVALVADAIKDVSRRGDLVFDPFLGSGTTLIAAHRTGRRCFGIELDPLYADVIIRRWEAETGREAVLASSGATFEASMALRLTVSAPVALLTGPSTSVEG